MLKLLTYLTSFDIPQSTSFKIAFAAVTVLYVIFMVILFILYKKAASKLPPKSKKDDNKSSYKSKSVRNKLRKHRRS